jgi:pyruvate ferredoxin oxidoreductase gamma subunit
MLQIRLHGRGGQGVVTSAELLSLAAFLEHRHAQAFPSFGSERMGAPVVAFCRIADAPIRTHEPILDPDVLIVQDPTLLHQADVFAGLSPGGTVLLNTGRDVAELGLAEFALEHRVVTIAATELARHHLGRPMPGAPLLGAFAAVTGALSLDSVTGAIQSVFPGRIGRGNAAAARAAYDLESADAGAA